MILALKVSSDKLSNIHNQWTHKLLDLVTIITWPFSYQEVEFRSIAVVDWFALLPSKLISRGFGCVVFEVTS